MTQTFGHFLLSLNCVHIDIWQQMCLCVLLLMNDCLRMEIWDLFSRLQYCVSQSNHTSSFSQTCPLFQRKNECACLGFPFSLMPLLAGPVQKLGNITSQLLNTSHPGEADPGPCWTPSGLTGILIHLLNQNHSTCIWSSKNERQSKNQMGRVIIIICAA